MKKALIALIAIMVVALMPQSQAAGVQIQLAPLSRSYNPPPLGRKQGWLVISNRDWQDYTMNIDYNSEKLYLYRAGEGWGSVHIPSGTSITIALNKNTWDLYGKTDSRLKVRVREGRTTSLSLEPFGYQGSAGLNGVVNDGDRVRNEVIFESYAPPVVVRPAPRPPTVIVEQPPVVVHRPPPVVVRPPAHRPPPPPPRRPPHGRPGRDKGWGFSLFFD